MNARTLSRLLVDARASAERNQLAKARDAYARTLERVARAARSSFTGITAAAWQPPPDGSILTPVALQKIAGRLNGDLESIWMSVVLDVPGTVLARAGIAWDVAHPLAQGLLDGAAQRTGAALGAAVQPILRKAVGDAYANGLSVRDTAATIQTALADAAPWQAEMLARTDLNSLANGASHAAARLVGVPFKTWDATLDDRTRLTHADAHGQTVPLDAPFDVGGEALDYPGDPNGSDAETINCRCTLIYANTLDEGQALLADGGGTIMDAMTTTKRSSRRAARPKAFAAATSMPSGMDSLPAGVKACSMNGRQGFSGGRLCYTHDGTEAGMQKAIVSAQRDVRANKATVAAVTAPDPLAVRFKGVAAVEGIPSDDNTAMPRTLLTKSLSWPDMPIPFMAQTVTAEGHDGAQVAGRIDKLTRKPGAAKGTYNIEFEGELTTPFGINDVAPMIHDQTLRGVSADLGATEWAIVDRHSLAEVPEADLDLDAMASGGYLLGLKSGKVRAVTLTPVQALEGANVALTASADSAVTLTIGDLELVAGALVASAAPVKPPRAWFETQEPPGKMPLTITAEGRVFGHLADWSSCHLSFLPSCVPPPRSASNYAYFHAGEVETAEGDRIAVGKLMVGGRHDNNLSHSREEAMRHYDDQSRVGAVLRAQDGKHGIWVSGALHHSVTDQQIADMKLNPPSGDWRIVNGQHELICGLSVPVPGFPIPRVEMQLVASGGDLQMGALVAALGPDEADPAAIAGLVASGALTDEQAVELDRADADRRLAVLAARAEGVDALLALAEA